MPVSRFVITGAAFAALACASCNRDGALPGPGGENGGTSDLAPSFPAPDLLGPAADLFGVCLEPNACGDCLPGCMTLAFGPDYQRPFPLLSDENRDPRQADNGGVGRNPNGYLVIDGGHPSIPALWIGNATDWNRGTASRFDSRTMREVARYFSVTCGSLPTGSTKRCDGVNGCCAADDPARYEARRNKQPEPGHQAVQTMGDFPSRAEAVPDCCGEHGLAVVENRAPAGQASITVFATDAWRCPDRNHDGRIQTSSDVNGDGLIETDCNADGQPDDVESVKARPCGNGLAQEFYGLDDECVLFTTNVGAMGQDGRGVALGPGDTDLEVDAWAATAKDGRVFRVDGPTGLIEEDATLPGGCQPDGLTVDSQGFAWAPSTNGVCYFDARPGKSAGAGRARDPGSGPVFARGIRMDRDQNVWLGDAGSGETWRYTPDRSKGFDNLGTGFWTRVQNPGKQNGASGPARAITVDSRSAKSYFSWLATADAVVEIPASAIATVKMDQTIDGTAYPVVRFPKFSIAGVATDNNANLVAVSGAPSTVLRAVVDQWGAITPPDLVSPPKGGTICPAGDRCPLANPGQPDPGSNPDGWFAEWSCRAFCRPIGQWSYVVAGCTDAQGAAADTDWMALEVSADLPPNTALIARLRAGATPVPDPTWGPWSMNIQLPAPSLDLRPLALQGGNLQVEFTFKTNDRSATPKLKSFRVAWRCSSLPP